MKDMIYRQAAIDAFDCTNELIVGGEANARNVVNYINKVVGKIKDLPAAQPEIIRCKDCKYYKAYEYTGELACHYVIGGTVIRNLNDYCSRAERIEHEQSD